MSGSNSQCFGRCHDLVSDRFDCGASADGHTGVDAGQGFHDFAATDVSDYRREKLATSLGLLRHFRLLAPPR